MSTLYVRDIPQDIHDRFYEWCQKRNLKMSCVIRELMREAVKDDSKIMTKAVIDAIKKGNIRPGRKKRYGS
jgi:hypothetical protein